MTASNNPPTSLDRPNGGCALTGCEEPVPARCSRFCCDAHSREYWTLKKRELRWLEGRLYIHVSTTDPTAYPKYLKRWNGDRAVYNARQRQVMRARRANEKALRAGVLPALNIAA